MMKLPSYICVAALALGAAACDGTSPDEAGIDTAPDPAAETTAGTSGFADDADADLQGTAGDDAAFGDATNEQDALPATASPLPLIGLAGLLSVGAAAAVRRLRSR